MVNRINLLLQAKNITARQFAEEIGIQPSGMSHILSGRNNPSLDFVMKVMKRWPEVNINWLMFGNGEMFTNIPPTIPSPLPKTMVDAAPSEPDLFSIMESPVPAELPEEETRAEVPLTAEPEMHLTQQAQVPDVPISTPKIQHVENPIFETPVNTGTVQPNVVEESKQPQLAVSALAGGKKIVKLIVLYEDHSFSEYYPE
ncbi:MAG: helix-turn-helix domain-containing protein [Bacteroidales bacterium]|nr:helix-turn-helix domain-containing protein [Bacteroidales bacterium]